MGQKVSACFERMLKVRIGWRKFTSLQYVQKLHASNKLVEGNLPILHMFERSRLKNNSSESTKLFYKQDLKERRKSSSSFLYSLEALLLVNCQSIFRSCTFQFSFWVAPKFAMTKGSTKGCCRRNKKTRKKKKAFKGQCMIVFWFFNRFAGLLLRPH